MNFQNYILSLLPNIEFQNSKIVYIFTSLMKWIADFALMEVYMGVGDD